MDIFIYLVQKYISIINKFSVLILLWHRSHIGIALFNIIVHGYVIGVAIGIISICNSINIIICNRVGIIWIIQLFLHLPCLFCLNDLIKGWGWESHWSFHNLVDALTKSNNFLLTELVNFFRKEFDKISQIRTINKSIDVRLILSSFLFFLIHNSDNYGNFFFAHFKNALLACFIFLQLNHWVYLLFLFLVESVEFLVKTLNPSFFDLVHHFAEPLLNFYTFTIDLIKNIDILALNLGIQILGTVIQINGLST